MDNQTFSVIWDKLRGLVAEFPDANTRTSGASLTLYGQTYVAVAGAYGYLLNTEEEQRTAYTVALCRVVAFTRPGGTTNIQFLRVGQFESAHDGVRWHTPHSELAANSVRDHIWSVLAAL